MTISPELLIFDFDGTIVDSKSIYYRNIKNVLESHNISDNEINKELDKGYKLGKTIRNLGFSWIYSWYLKHKIMKQVLSEVNEVKKCKDVSDIKKIDHKKILVSNSLSEFIMPVLKHLNLKNYFLEIYSGDDFDNKIDFIKNYLEENNIDKNKCIYIGDRVADIEVAKKVGCLGMILTNKCSWDSREDLIEAEPDFLIDDLKELNDVLE